MFVLQMWKCVAVLIVLTGCAGRPEEEPDCFGIYCNNNNSTETGDYSKYYYYGEGEMYEEYDQSNTSTLARQYPLFYRTFPSFRVVM